MADVLGVPRAAAREALEDLVAVAGTLAGLEVHLFSNNVQPNADLTIDDLTEATFVGYAAFAGPVVWGVPFFNQAGKPQVNGEEVLFTAGAVTGPETVYGYWCESAADGLVFAVRFATPILIDSAGQGVSVIPSFSLASAA